MLLEFVHHLVHPSEIVWTTKFVSTENALPDVLKIISVPLSMNVAVEFVLWLKNVDPTLTAPPLSLVPRPFLL